MKNTEDGFEDSLKNIGGSEGTADPKSDAVKIVYLIQELDKWHNEGILTPDAYQGLRQRYADEHQELLRRIRASELLNDARKARGQLSPTDALTRITTALELDPDSIEMKCLMAATYEDLGRFDEALTVYESLEAIYPDVVVVRDGLIRTRKALEDKKHLQEQAKTLYTIVDMANLGHFDSAIAQCESFVDAYPDIVEGRFLLIKLLGQVKRTEDAIVQAKLGLTINPNNSQFQAEIASLESVLAKTLYEEHVQQQRELAEEMNRQRISRAEELTTQASKKFVQSRFGEALNDVKEAIDLDSHNMPARILCARIYSSQELWELAEQAWTTVVQLDSINVEYRAELRKASEARIYQQRSVWSKLWETGSQTIEAFMEERNIQWVHMMGAAILLAGLIGVSAWMVTVQKLWGVVGRVLVVIVPLIVVFVFYYISHKLRETMKATSTAFMVIASCVMPLDIVMAKYLFPEIFGWRWDNHLFAMSLVCMLVYSSILYISRTRTLVTFAGIGFLSVNFFLMRMLPDIGPGIQGVWFAIIGFVYILIAWRLQVRDLSPLGLPINILAHASMAWALGTTLFIGPTSQTGLGSTMNILVVSAVYLSTAYIFNNARYMPVFAVVFLSFLVFAMKANGIGIEQWYLYGLAFGVTGCLFIGMVPMSKVQDKDEFAECYQWFGLGVTAISVLFAIGKGAMAVILTQSLPSGAQLFPSLLTCLIVGVFYAAASVWTEKPRLLYGSTLVIIYSALLALRLESRPTHEYTVWLMLLAVAMVAFGWRLRRTWEEHGQIVLDLGRAFAVVVGTVSIGLWADRGVAKPAYRDAAWLAMLQAAIISSAAVRFSRKPIYVYSAIVSAALWWGAGFSWLNAHWFATLLGSEINYGLYYLPFIGLLMWVERALRKSDNPAKATPCDVFSLMLSAAALVMQIYYIKPPGPMLHSVWVSLIVYSALFAGQAWNRRAESLFGTKVSVTSVYAFLSMLSFWGAAFYILDRIGVNHTLTASAIMLVGTIGASVAACLLTEARKPYCVRGLLLNACSVFTFGCYYGFFWGNPQAALFGVSIMAIYLALAYGTKVPSFPLLSAFTFGALYTIVAIAAYIPMHDAGFQLLPYYSIVMTALSGVAFVRLAGLIRTRPPAYIATLSFFEAASMLVFHLTANSAMPGLHRVGFAVISVMLLLVAWILASRNEDIFAEAPCVLGFTVLSTDVVVSVTSLLWTLNATDRLIAFIVTGAAAISFGISSMVTHRRWSLWPAMLTLSIAYGLAGAQWVIPRVAYEHANYGIWFWPLAASLAVGGQLLHRKRNPGFAWILLIASASLVALSLLLQHDYSLITESIALFAYGILLAWMAIASRGWADGILANVLSQGLVYASAALLSVAWLLAFDYVGLRESQLAIYRSIAALTGLALCIVGFRFSAWMSARGWEWWARPLFWSAVVSGFLWNVWSVAWSHSAYLLALATPCLTIVFYCWIALAHRNKAYAYGGLAAFVLGYLVVFDEVGGFHAAPVRLAAFAAASVIAAVCTGYLSMSFRSLVLAYLSTLAVCWSYIIALHAGIKAAEMSDHSWYALGFAGFGLVLLLIFRLLQKSGFGDIAEAPALGSTVMTTIGALIAPLVVFDGFSHHWAISAGSMGVCVIVYTLSAHLRERPGFVYAACTAAAVGWGLVEWTTLLRVDSVNYGLVYLPLAVLLGAFAYLARIRQSDVFDEPLWYSALVISIMSGVLQVLYVGAVPLRTSVSLTMLLLAAAYAASSYLERQTTWRVGMLTYLSCASLLSSAATLHWPVHLAVLFNPAMPFLYVLIGAAWAATALFLEKRSWSAWVLPLLISAGVAQIIAVVDTSISTGLYSMWWNVASLITVAVTFAWVAIRTDSPALIHAGGGLVLIGSIGLWWQNGICVSGERWPLLLTALIPAIGAGVLGQIKKHEVYVGWSAGLLWVAFFGYMVSPGLHALMPDPLFCAMFVVAMGICAALYQRVARTLELPVFDLMAALCGLVAYWYMVTLVHWAVPVIHSPSQHPSIALLPYAAFMAWVCWQQTPSGKEPTYCPYGTVALGLAVIGLVINIGSQESLILRMVTSGLYTVGFVLAASKFASRSLAYMANASAALALFILYLGYAVSQAASVLVPEPFICVVLAVAMGICAVFDQRIAKALELPVLDLMAALSGLAAYWYMVALVHWAVPVIHSPAQHVSITLLPYAAFIAWVCWRLKPSGKEPTCGPYGMVALGLAVIGLAYNIGSHETLVLRSVTAGLYTVGFVLVASKFASMLLAYMANASAILTWWTLYLTLGLPSPDQAMPMFCAWFGILGVLMVDIGVVFDKCAKAPEIARAEYTIGITLSSISAFVALAATPSARQFGEWTVAALLLSTIAHSTMAIIYRRVEYVHAGFLGVLISLYMVFYDKLNLRVLDVYALPIGIYLIALPAISGFVGRNVRHNPYFSAGLAVILGSGLITIVQSGWESWNSYLMLVESVAAFLYGVGRRRKMFFFFGSIFSVIWIAILVRDSIIIRMHGGTLVAGILGIVVGAGLIAFASRSEQRRNEFVDSWKNAVQSVREWD